MPLPKRYVDDMRNAPHVQDGDVGELVRRQGPEARPKSSSPRSRSIPTATSASTTRSASPPSSTSRKHDKQGAIVGDVAREEARLEGRRQDHAPERDLPGRLGVHVDGIYNDDGAIARPLELLFHWDVPERHRSRRRGSDQIGWIVSRVDDPSQSGRRRRRRSTSLRRAGHPDATQDERALNSAFLGDVLGDPDGDEHRLGGDPRHHDAHPRQHDRDGRARADGRVRRAPRDWLLARHVRLFIVGESLVLGAPRRRRSASGSRAPSSTWGSGAGSRRTWGRSSPTSGSATARDLAARASRPRSAASPPSSRPWRASQLRSSTPLAEDRMIPIRYNLRSLAVRKATTVAAAFGIALVVFVFASSLMLSAGIKQDARHLGPAPTSRSCCARAPTRSSASAIEDADVSRSSRAPGREATTRRASRSASARSSWWPPRRRSAPTASRTSQIRGVTDGRAARSARGHVIDGRAAPPGRSDEVIIGSAHPRPLQGARARSDRSS